MRPTSRLVVDVVELCRHTGTRRRFEATTGIGGGLAAGDFTVVAGRLDVDLVIESVTEGVVAKGSATGRWTGPCRRCLDPIIEPLVVEVHEIFERHPTEGETWPIDDERIDLAPALREAALLSLPLVPLCRDDCPGPEPERFPTTGVVDLDVTGDAPRPDPRWAALDDLRFDE